MKRINWIFAFILVLFLVSFNSNLNSVEITDEITLITPETQQPMISVADSAGPIIGIPSLDNPNPDTDDNVQVTSPIEDVDSVQNATLFWQYVTKNNTIFNSTVTSPTSPNSLFIDYSAFTFPVTGYITDFGQKTTYPQDWAYGEYIFEDSAVTDIALDLTRYPGNAALVYILVQAKNVTTGLWQTVHEYGGYGQTSVISSTNDDYAYTGLTLGYRIFAVTYRAAGFPTLPRFDYLQMWRDEYIWPIPAVVTEPSYVNYYILAYDTLNQSSTSPLYTFLMDFAPTITIDRPPVLASDQDYLLNVTIDDQDGYKTVNVSSTVAQYQFTDDTDWTDIPLSHQEFGNTHQFSGTLPASNLGAIETNMFVRVNTSDVVAGVKGRESIAFDSIPIDSLAPRVQTLVIHGGVTDSMLQNRNITLINSNITFEVTFEDAFGISSVSLYSSQPNGTTLIKREMVNTTFKGPYVPPQYPPYPTFVTFNVTLPASNETMYVDYFFETEDFIGNKGNTSFHSCYSDASGPVLDTLLIHPHIISNYTDVLVLLNASDPSLLRQLDLFYRLENQSSWSGPIRATQIDYSNLVDYQETFSATDLPFIENSAISSYPLEISRNGPIDTAVIIFNITHEMPTDLRIWLRLDDGRKFMLFDREAGPNTINRGIDLIKLGLTEADFNKGNFTLEIQDFSNLYSGSLTNYQVMVLHHSVPLGYQWAMMIPASISDNTVFFYIIMTDRLWNSANTTTYEYYSDGLAPSVSIIGHTSTVDLAGEHSLSISALIEDQGGILGVEAYYKFSEEDEWMVGPMINNTSGSYSFDVPIPNASGIIFYKVRAYDLTGLSNETAIFYTTYSNGLAPFIEILGIPYPVPLDMNGTNTIRVWANVTDDGTIANCTISYQFDSGDFVNEEMIFDNETGVYYFDIKVSKRSGNLTFTIYAQDNLDLSTESDPYTIEFENAGTTPGLPADLILFGAVLAVGGGGSVATIVVLYKKGKLPGRGY